jgi:proline iminopeptidase
LSLQDLIEDCEALRQYLRIERWSVLGHSFGSDLALNYALAYPNTVDRLLFENPSFDMVLSTRSLLVGAAEEFSQLGQQARAAACHSVLKEQHDARALWETFSQLMSELGERRNYLYVHGPEESFFEELVAASPLSAEQWGRAVLHQLLLVEEGSIFDSAGVNLARCHLPALFIRGKYDRVASQDQVLACKDLKPLGHLQTFEYSSHFVRFEEPDVYMRQQ